jgi:hypothetical protein
MLPTVAHYMVEPVREGFLDLLDAISAKDQETVLLDAAEHCQEVQIKEETNASRTGARREDVSRQSDHSLIMRKNEERVKLVEAA